MAKEIKVVTIGGGGGQAQVLKGLADIPNLTITAICPSTDSGGSTGVLQRDYETRGYLGDLTKCIAALCPDKVLSQSLLFRYGEGCLHGHSVKNILFLGLEKVAGLAKALEIMYRVCELGRHRVIPVTTESAELCARLKIGNTIEGETRIDMIAKNPLWHPDYHAIQDIYLRPSVQASQDACRAIEEADWIVLCPGDLYSSLLPVILPQGIKESFVNSQAKVVSIMNIMTKNGETDNYKTMDFVV